MRHVSRIKKTGIWPPFEVLDTHFSLFLREQTYHTTQANNDARRCNFACDYDFTLFTYLLPATSVRASYHFSPSLDFFRTDYRVRAAVNTRRILVDIHAGAEYFPSQLLQSFLHYVMAFSPTSAPGALTDLHSC